MKALIIIFLFFNTYTNAQNVTTPAEIINCPSTNYPNLAKRLGQEGQVVLRAYISETGTVTDIIIEKSSNSKHLDNEAIKSLKGCIFKPATVDGEQRKSDITRKYNFLKDQHLNYITSNANQSLLKESNLQRIKFENFNSIVDEIPLCRLQKINIENSLEKFIEAAFNSELKASQKYDIDGKSFSGTIKRIVLSTVLQSYWIIEIDIFSPDGSTSSIEIKVDFPTNLDTYKSCQNAKEHLILAIQLLFFKFIKTYN